MAPPETLVRTLLPVLWTRDAPLARGLVPIPGTGASTTAAIPLTPASPDGVWASCPMGYPENPRGASPRGHQRGKTKCQPDSSQFGQCGIASRTRTSFKGNPHPQLPQPQPSGTSIAKAVPTGSTPGFSARALSRNATFSSAGRSANLRGSAMWRMLVSRSPQLHEPTSGPHPAPPSFRTHQPNSATWWTLAGTKCVKQVPEPRCQA